MTSNARPDILETATFRSHYLLTVLLLLCVWLGLVGNPAAVIRCVYTKSDIVQQEYVDDYCLMNSPYYYPPINSDESEITNDGNNKARQYAPIGPYLSPRSSKESQDERLEISYYGWVPYLVFLQVSTYLIMTTYSYMNTCPINYCYQYLGCRLFSSAFQKGYGRI